jgi:uncharacterized delta-60 repeat protein
MGYFTMLGGQPHAYIGRLNPDGSVDHSFNAQANAPVRTVAVQPDGRIVVVGGFTTMNGQPRRLIARLHPDGSLDTAFKPFADGTEVHSVALEANGKIVVGGDFATLNYEPRSRIGRLNRDGSLDTGFNPGANEFVRVVALQSDGKILAGGMFTMLGGQTRNGLGRLNADGSLDKTFNPGAENYIVRNTLVNAFAVQPQGHIVVGGLFVSLGGAPHTNLGRLTLQGSVEPGFLANANNYINGLMAQPDGKTIVVGGFERLSGQERNSIGRLNADGTADPNFSPVFVQSCSGFSHLEILGLASQADGKILVWGRFNRVNGAPRMNLARLNPDGTLDATFAADAGIGPCSDSTYVSSLAVQPDGKILVAGYFSQLAGQARMNMGRLNADGSLDVEFEAATTINSVYAMAVQADGKILVGGSYFLLNGQTRTNLGRLNPDGSLDAAFNPVVTGPTTSNGPPAVYSLALQADGKILLAGHFSSVAGQPRQRIARITPDGAVDAFNPAVEHIVFSLALQDDGKILVGGVFTLLGGQPRSRIGRLANDTAALQRLALDSSGTAVTWSRGGSAPEIEQVTFEGSVDGTNYALLGHAARVSGGWRLEGLALPAGQSLHVRARGRTVGGMRNGTGGLIESVAQFWRLPPPFISSVQVLAGGTFQFSFNNTNAAYFSVLANANVAAPVAEWEVLGAPVPVGGGLYQFTDPGATNHPRRFYQLRSP